MGRDQSINEKYIKIIGQSMNEKYMFYNIFQIFSTNTNSYQNETFRFFRSRKSYIIKSVINFAAIFFECTTSKNYSEAHL
jgi:hypothetical protein